MCPIQFFCLVLITCISMKGLFFHLFQYFFIHSVFCSADPLHPPPYPHLILYNYIITSLTARGAARGRHFCKGICPGLPWCGAATSQLTQCILSVPRQFVHQHFVYDTSSTDISSTDIWYTTVL